MATDSATLMAEYRQAYCAVHGGKPVIIQRGGRYFINPYKNEKGEFETSPNSGHTARVIEQATANLWRRVEDRDD